jgi:hypothetical protein
MLVRPALTLPAEWNLVFFELLLKTKDQIGFASSFVFGVRPGNTLGT